MGERQPIAAALLAELSSVEPRAILLEQRVFRRVLRQDAGLTGSGVAVPHGLGWRIESSALRDLVDDDEWGPSGPVADHQEQLWCFPQPSARELDAVAVEALYLRYWRHLFHLRLDEALDAAQHTGELSDATIAERIDRIGQTQFDEIRAVLRHELRLLPQDDDRTTYREFAALYFELRFFAPEDIGQYFPTLAGEALAAVERLLMGDVPAAELFAAARLPSAPDPIEWARAHRVKDDVPSEAIATDTEPLETLHADAEEAERLGNVVRAALSFRRVALRTRDAEPRQMLDDRAQSNLEGLVASLAETLDFEASEVPAEQWRDALWPLVCHAATPGMTPATRVLLDIQKVALDSDASDREIYKLDVYGWLTSLGRQPLKRALPTDRLERRVRNLRRARKRLQRVRVTDAQQSALSLLLVKAQDRAESRLRAVLTVELEAALDEVGLTPESTTGTVARAKLVAELCDQVVEGGLIHIGHVRDAISRNDLKLGNLGGPGKFLRGDELLQINKRLGQRLGGVYRRGEAYMRGLQKISSLLFGTLLGQLLTRYIILPFGGSFTLIEGFDHVIMPLVKIFVTTDFRLMSLASFLIGSVLLFAIIHLPPFRHVVWEGLKAVGRSIKAVLVDLPRAVWNWDPIQAAWNSSAMRLVRRFVIKPALFGGVLWVLVPILGAPGTVNIITAAVLFVLANLVLNSRYGRRAEEAVRDTAARSWHGVRHRILPGMLRWIIEVFRVGLELLERGLYRVDEFLRFRRGDHLVTVVFKTVGAVIWGTLAYVIRIYVNILIEPQVNPIKHFPVVTVAHKLMLPALPELTRLMLTVTEPVMGTIVGTSFTLATIFLLPGIAGFLVWEFKENWKLYGANRGHAIKPSVIGHHSETMARLMRPGFHSGTLPKLYTKLRRAGATWRRGAAAKARHGLVEVEHAVHQFVDRELIGLLGVSGSWGGLAVRVGHIRLGSNMVRIDLEAPDRPELGPAVVAFEEQSGWLVASIGRLGWIESLDPAQRAFLGTALTGLYKRAGVDIVREQVREVVGEVQAYDVADEGLIVWPGPGYAEREVRVISQEDSPELLFSSRPLGWAQWDGLLEGERKGERPPEAPLGTVLPAAA